MTRYPRRAGWTEPTTSKEAAEFVEAKGIAPTIRQALEDLFSRGWEGTAFEAADRLGRSYASVQPRISELHAAGSVVPVRRTMGPNGTTVWVWAWWNRQWRLL